LHDAVEKLTRGCLKAFVLAFLLAPTPSPSGRSSAVGARNRSDQIIAGKGIELIEPDQRNGQATARLWWGERPPLADDDVNVTTIRPSANRFHQQIKVSGIAWADDVGIDPLDQENPAQLADEVAIRPVGQHPLQDLAVGEPVVVPPARDLHELLFDGQARKAWRDLT
jgi:hypothetical protein